MNGRKIFLSTTLVLAAVFQSSAGYTNFNYGNMDPASQALWGTSKQESYDIAMRIADSSLAGKHITTVTIPVTENEKISDYSIWLSKELKVEGKVNVPDMGFWSCTPKDGMITIKFDKPVEIPAGGLYVGYSFVMSALNAAAKQPIVVTEFTMWEESFYIHTNRTYKAWTNISTRNYLSPVINVCIEGEFGENSVRPVNLPETNLKSGADNVVRLGVRNTGGNPVKQLGYTIYWDGKTLEGVTTPDKEVEPSFLGETYVELPVAADKLPLASGLYPTKVTLTQVNGVSNAAAANSLEGEVHILSFIPTHRPVLEEYTGTWCGYCPRGYVGLEVMNHLYPDDFIGVSYHSGDNMAVINNADFASPIDGFPDAWVDRVEHTDAYSGRYSDNKFGIDLVWQLRRAHVAPADIDLKAKFEGDGGKEIKVDADVRFAKANSKADLRLVYMLIGNGMTHPAWIQANNYSGETSFADSPWYDDFWKQFVEGSPNVRGLVYNDILLAATDLKGTGHELPAEISADQSFSYSHSFITDEVRNLKGDYIIQDADKLYAVVMLVDGSDGHILNANKVHVEGASSVSACALDKEVVSVTYTDLSGVMVANPSKGIYVKTTEYSDGTKKNEKLVVNN